MQLVEFPLSGIRRMRVELDSIARENESRPRAADRDDLVKRANEALEAARSMRIAEFVVVAATRMATLLNDSGRPIDARRAIEENEPLPAELQDHPLGVSFETQRVRATAALARSETDPRAALKLWHDVDRRTSSLIDLVEALRTRVSVPDLFNAYTRFSIEVYALAVESRIALGDAEGAIGRIELVKCRSIHRMQGQGGSEADDSGLRNEFRNLSHTIDDIRTQGGPPPNELLARRRAIWDLLSVDRFSERAGTFTAFDVAVFQSRLPVGMVALSWFWLDRERLVVVAVGADRVAVALQQIGELIRAEIDEKAEQILSFADGDSKMRTKLRPGLADLLFPPAVRDVMTTASRLILSPHRSLHALPLHALPWSDGRPLIRHYAISYAPNLTTLLAPSRMRARESVLFVGVPERATGLHGPPLDGTVRECSDLRDLYGAALLTEQVGPIATESQLRHLDETGELAQFRVMHFACHGVSIDSDNPMESKLLLYDSELDGLDISDWRLGADIVVLSACSAGQRPVRGRGLKELPGDELFGLQAAFFAAGARGVLATQWPVSDDVAPTICASFHEHWRRHPADIALQMAVCDYLDFHGRIMERTPHTWACFFLTTTRLPEAPQREERP